MQNMMNSRRSMTAAASSQSFLFFSSSSSISRFTVSLCNFACRRSRISSWIFISGFTASAYAKSNSFPCRLSSRKFPASRSSPSTLLTTGERSFKGDASKSRSAASFLQTCDLIWTQYNHRRRHSSVIWTAISPKSPSSPACLSYLPYPVPSFIWELPGPIDI